MAQTITLNICHLYPDLMDTYGDKGNITTLIKRCHWRGIKAIVNHITVGDKLNPEIHDIYFFGGGQDRQQVIVGRDLQSKAKNLKRAINQGSVLLAICGGYQLLQKHFKTLDGTIIKGIGLFNAHTLGSPSRMIGDLLIETKEYGQMIGFENHSGKTYLGKSLKPMGKVIKGFGNNGEDKTEGAVYKNAFGCYLHGSLLPKNPHFADFLITKALERRYGKVKLKPLDDSIEWQAHNAAINRTRSSS